MAYTVSNNYRKVIYSGGAEHTALLTIGEETIDVSNIKSITISDSIIDKTSQVFYLGSFISKQIEVTFRNANNIDLSGQVNLKIGTKVDGEWEYVPIGIFNIETSPEDYYKNAKITCLDNGVKFKPNVDVSQFFDIIIGQNSDGSDIMGITLENLLKTLCKHFLGENMLGTYPTINKDIVVASYDSTISGKQYISWIAELMGSNAKIGRDGKLCLQPIKCVSTVTIDALTGKSLVIDTKYRISKVRFDNGAVIPNEFGNDTHNTLNIRTDNMLFSGDDDTRDEIIENIYNSVKDLEIWNIQTENYGDLSLDSFDIVTYNAPEDSKSYTTFYTYNITYEQTIMSKINTEIPSKQVEKTTNVIKDDTNGKIRSIRTTINQIENTLDTTVTETIPNIKDDVSSNYNELLTNFNNYLPNGSLDQITNQVNQIIGSSYTKTEVNQIVNGTGVNGVKVTYVTTEMGTFDMNGLTIDRSNSPTAGRFNEEGIRVLQKLEDGSIGEPVLEAIFNKRKGTSEVNASNLNAKNYLLLDKVSRFQNFMDGTQQKSGCFWTGYKPKTFKFDIENANNYWFVFNKGDMSFTSNTSNAGKVTAQTTLTFTEKAEYVEIDVIKGEICINNTWMITHIKAGGGGSTTVVGKRSYSYPVINVGDKLILENTVGLTVDNLENYGYMTFKFVTE